MTDQSRYAFRPGVTCVTTPAAAVLLSPPHREKLTGLTGGALTALKTLNGGAATLAQLSAGRGDDVSALIERLTAAGWLTVTVCDDAAEWYSVQPFAAPGAPAATRHSATATAARRADDRIRNAASRTNRAQRMNTPRARRDTPALPES